MTDFWTSKKILVVEDNPGTLGELVKIYEEMGLQVIEAVESAQKALELLKSLTPDFISLDIIMPEMDGIECYKKIKELEIKARVFFVSALCSDARVINAYSNEIGENCFLAKPLTGESMRKYLNKIHSDETMSH